MMKIDQLLFSPIKTQQAMLCFNRRETYHWIKPPSLGELHSPEVAFLLLTQWVRFSAFPNFFDVVKTYWWRWLYKSAQRLDKVPGMGE